jgi:hypothetical protein
MIAPLDDPALAEFVARLDEINAIADHAPGFVWRLQSEDGNATSIRPFDDARILVNMSVWESVDALKRFVYFSRHREVLGKRREWFEEFSGAYFVMWWLPAGHVPTVAEAKTRLQYFERVGESDYAFTFKHPVPAPLQLADAKSQAKEQV